MFVHAVYFTLRPDLSAADQDRFAASLRSLLDIASVRHGYIGAPAATDRPVIVRDYTHALVVVFDDDAGHDAYQVDPIHDRFRDDCSPLWSAVRIFDSVGEDTR